MDTYGHVFEEEKLAAADCLSQKIGSGSYTSQELAGDEYQQERVWHVRFIRQGLKKLKIEGVAVEVAKGVHLETLFCISLREVGWPNSDPTREQPLENPGKKAPSRGNLRNRAPNCEAPRTGIEPVTCGLEDRCSIQLSYRGRLFSDKGLRRFSGFSSVYRLIRLFIRPYAEKPFVPACWATASSRSSYQCHDDRQPTCAAVRGAIIWSTSTWSIVASASVPPCNRANDSIIDQRSLIRLA